MQQRWSLIFVLLAALAACNDNPDGPSSPAGATAATQGQPSTEEAPVVTQTLSFQASDGASLHASMRANGDFSPRPLIIEFSPYGAGSDIPDFGPAYNHIYVQARGTGNSTGQWSAVGPRDQQDVAEFLAWACE